MTSTQRCRIIFAARYRDLSLPSENPRGIMGYAGAQPGFLRAGEVLAKRGHIDIVSTRGATMVGAEGKIFGIWTIQIGLKCPSQALFRGKVTFKIRDFCLFVTFYYKKRAQLYIYFFIFSLLCFAYCLMVNVKGHVPAHVGCLTSCLCPLFDLCICNKS